MSKRVIIADQSDLIKSQKEMRRQIRDWLDETTKLEYDGKEYKIVGLRKKYLFLQSGTDFIWLHFNIKRLALFEDKFIVDRRKTWKRLN
jgi:hypothetical protein